MRDERNVLHALLLVSSGSQILALLAQCFLRTYDKDIIIGLRKTFKN